MILVPIRTVTGLNAREHHHAKARRVKSERQYVAWALLGKPKPEVPCTVRLIRASPSHIPTDDDNLVGALKAVRDAVADWLGIDDKLSDLVRYVYAQKRGPWAVEIDFGKHLPCDVFELLENRSTDG